MNDELAKKIVYFPMNLSGIDGAACHTLFSGGASTDQVSISLPATGSCCFKVYPRTHDGRKCIREQDAGLSIRPVSGWHRLFERT